MTPGADADADLADSFDKFFALLEPPLELRRELQWCAECVEVCKCTRVRGDVSHVWGREEGYLVKHQCEDAPNLKRD
jgi:hypothetical protein